MTNPRGHRGDQRGRGGGAPPPCSSCGEPLGVYEPLHWRRPDGSVVRCGWLQARTDPDHAHPLSAFFHVACHRRTVADTA
ncbi:MAG: hypothetical protein ACXVFN_02450 [Solirubrobacteraceae bacterium]